ncbi:type II secretion system protein N [Sulfuricaulis sp.]|uniref:type II secretion system protein N n=1 Tax=Sulfuricaulis sp. TaxID=2003553 RepID=UPI00355A4C0E
MKKRWLLYAVFGLVFYLLFLIIEMPASWFAWGLDYYTHNTVRLDPLSGSLWHGKGRLVIYYPQTVPHDFGQTEWSINPFWLLTGRVQLTLQTNTPDRQIKTTLGIAKESLSIKDTDAAFPATFVSQLYPPATLIGPQGQIRLRTSDLVFGQKNLEGNATLEWQGAGSSLSNVKPLGDYRLEIIGAGKTANLKLSTARGALELTGQGQWQTQTGQVQLTGSALPRERAAELESLLKLLGEDQGNGKRQLMLNSYLPKLQ